MATYTARSDHLRRVLQKSRQRRIASHFGWRSILVNAAGLGYAVSLAMQTLWHLYGSQVTQRNTVQAMSPEDCLRHPAFMAQCVDSAEPFVGLSLVLGLLCLWWNPKWQHKLSNAEGRLYYLNEYYLAQFLLLGLRLSAWIVIFHVPIPVRTKAMLHAGFALAIAIIAGWSTFGIIKVRLATPINWYQDPASLLSSNMHVPPPSRPEPQGLPQQLDRPFNVSNLAGPARTSYQSWNPPTPPSDGESMDWTPSHRPLQPELKPLRYRSTGPTPFRGTISALNPRGVHRNSNQAQSGREAIGLPPGFFDKPSNPILPPREATAASEAMALPTFFGHNRDPDTGLESIFDTVFSLQDRSSGGERSTSIPAGSGMANGQPRQRDNIDVPTVNQQPSLPAIFSCISIFSVAVGLAAWIFEAAIAPKTPQLGYYLVLSSTAIPVGHALLSLYGNGPRVEISTLLLYAFEVSVLVGVAELRELFGDLFRDLWDKLAIAVVALLLPHEFLALNRSHSLPQPQYPIVRSESEPQRSRTARERNMAGISRKMMPGLVRTNSMESMESEKSIATTTSAGPWATPRTENPRFDYSEPHRGSARHPTRDTARTVAAHADSVADYRQKKSSSGNRPSDGRKWGIGGLSLDHDSGVCRDEDAGVTSMFGRSMNFNTPSSGTGLVGTRGTQRRL